MDIWVSFFIFLFTYSLIEVAKIVFRITHSHWHRWIAEIWKHSHNRMLLLMKGIWHEKVLHNIWSFRFGVDFVITFNFADIPHTFRFWIMLLINVSFNGQKLYVQYLSQKCIRFRSRPSLHWKRSCGIVLATLYAS